MTQEQFLLILLTIPCGLGLISLGIVIIGFKGAHKLEESFPKLENHISLALWSSIPATLVSLSYVRLVTHGPEYLPLEGAYLFIRGWPVGFYGYIGINLLVLPIYILIDIGFWSLAGLVLILCLDLLKRRAPQSIWRKLTTGTTTIFIILSPLIPAGLKVLYDAVEKQKYETWLITSVGEIKQSFNLSDCKEQLAPSSVTNGAYDIEVTVTATIKKPSHDLVEAIFSNIWSQLTVLPPEQGLGDHSIQFTFPTVMRWGIGFWISLAHIPLIYNWFI